MSPSMLKTLVAVDAMAGIFTRRRKITSEQARAAFHQATFSSKKVKDATGMEFTPVESVIRQVAEFYRVDHP